MVSQVAEHRDTLLAQPEDARSKWSAARVSGVTGIVAGSIAGNVAQDFAWDVLAAGNALLEKLM